MIIMTSDDDSRRYFYRFIDYAVGKENLEQVREDFKWIAYDNVEAFKRWNPSKQFLRKEIKNAHDKAQRSKWDRVGFFIGVITSFSVVIPIPFNTFLTVAGLLISSLTLFRRVAVTMVLYDDPYRIYDDRQLKFAYAWNRGMNGWTSLLVMPIGVLNRITPNDYKLSLWVIEDTINSEYE